MKSLLFNLSCCIVVFGGQSPVSVSIGAPYDIGNGSGVSLSIKVTNLSASAISGIIVKSTCVKRFDRSQRINTITFDDTLSRFRDRGPLILPGATKEYPMRDTPIEEWECTGELKAATFEDGTSIGEADVLGRLRQNRLLVAREVDWHIKALSDARGRHDRLDVAVDALKNHTKSAMNAARSRDDEATIQSVSTGIDIDLRGVGQHNEPPLSDDQHLDLTLGRLRKWQERLASVNGAGQH
jgi:hypothetical protein